MKPTALVTGGAKRLGAYLCEFLAMQGYDIVIHCNNSIKQARVLQKKISKHTNCKIFKADLSNPKKFQIAIRTFFKRKTRIDLLIHNASIYPQKKFHESSHQDLMENFGVHVFAPFLLNQIMQKQNHQAHIIHIIDGGVHRFDQHHFVYQLSKNALYSLNQMLAIELAPKIRVNAIMPGPIQKPANMSLKKYNQVLKALPMGREGGFDEIAKALKSLIDNEYITGQVVYVDGGFHLKGGCIR